MVIGEGVKGSGWNRLRQRPLSALELLLASGLDGAAVLGQIDRRRQGPDRLGVKEWLGILRHDPARGGGF